MKLGLLVLLSLLTLFGRSQTWTQLADFPGGERDDGTTFVLGNYAYCGTGLKAGFGVTKDLFKFEMTTYSWDTVASLPLGTERQYACGFSDNTYGYIFGGIDGFGNALNDLWQYSPLTNSWTAMPPKPGAGIYGSACFVINGKAYIIGGSNSLTSASSEVWAYDFVTKTWSKKNNLPFGGSFRASATATNGKGYLVFGRKLNGTFNTNLYEYSPNLDVWSYYTYFQGGVGRFYTAMQNINNSLILFAGTDSLANCYNDLWSYTLSTGFWNLKSFLPSFKRKGGMSFTNGSTFFYTAGIDASNVRTKETWKTDIYVGIDEQEKFQKMLIYPNPASTFITVELPFENKGSSYVISDVLGNMVREKALTGKTISLDGIEPGIYSLTVFTKSGNLNSKLLIQ